MNAATDRSPLYLEDLTVGLIHRSAGEPEAVSAEAIKAFAREFDPQPFHLDETAAQNTFFKGLAASGWHAAALTMRLLVRQGPPLAGGIIGAGLDELRWPRPLRPGERLRIESEVIEVRPLRSRPDQGFAKVRVTTLSDAGDPVQVMIANLLVQRRPATGA